MPLNAFATHRPSAKAWHGRKPIPYLPMASGIQTCSRRVCGSTTGHWGSGNAALTISRRRCRTVPYTSSDISRFPTMLLFPRPFGSRSGGRLGVICLELRPPQEAIPSVRDTAHTFASYGSRQRDLMGQVHFASSTVHSPWTALRVRWVPVYWFPTLCLRAFAMCAVFPHSDYYALFDCLQGLGAFGAGLPCLLPTLLHIPCRLSRVQRVGLK